MEIAVITDVFLGTGADLSRSVCLPTHAGTVPLTLNCSSHCWFAKIFFAWLWTHNYYIHSSAKFLFPNGMIQSSLNSKQRFALASGESGSYCTCLLPNTFLADKAQAVLELSYGRVTTAGGTREERWGDAWGDMGRDRLPRTQGWGHALGRRDTPVGLWPMSPHQGKGSAEGPRPGRNPRWSSDSEKSRAEEKTPKNCGRGADGSHYTFQQSHTILSFVPKP